MFVAGDCLGTTLNNHKSSTYALGGKGPGGLSAAATKRPPIHFNNNLGTSTWAGTAGGGAGAGVGNIGTGEKNILKGSTGTKNCRNCQDDKKGFYIHIMSHDFVHCLLIKVFVYVIAARNLGLPIF